MDKGTLKASIVCHMHPQMSEEFKALTTSPEDSSLILSTHMEACNHL